LVFAAFLAQAPGQNGSLDPDFGKVPFDKWFSERETMRVRWSDTVDSPKLSFHQRLVATITVKVDGRDLQDRREGRLVYFVQITDAAGARYQNHGVVDLDKLENVKSIDVEYRPSAFVLPGEYQLATAIFSTATGEHSTRQSRFRVPPPKLDFLRDSWRNLPPVEFLGNQEPPDLWYLPNIAGRLQWASALAAPARLNVVLNIVAPPPSTTARQGESVELAALIPTLRSLAETGAPSLAERIKVLDLSRHRAVFNQDRGEIDWAKLKGALGQGNTASIDIGSLSDRHHDAQFFVREVRKLLTSASEQQPCALVVLSPPVTFESGEDLDPISLEALPACRAFYVRYRAPPPARQMGDIFGGMPGGRRTMGPRGGPMRPPPRAAQVVIDQLEQTLRPLNPRVFDVEAPEQMTRVFMEIERALASGGGARP
jgi:hypothetical protein